MEVAVHDDVERERSPIALCRDRHRRAGRDVLEQVAAAEVHRPRDLGRIGLVAGDLDPRRDVRIRRRRTQRRNQAPHLELRGIDPVRKRARLIDRVPDVAGHLREQLLRGRRVGVHRTRREFEVGGETHQLLLHAVVQRALEAAALGVGGQGESLARGTQVVGLDTQPIERSHFVGLPIPQGDRPLSIPSITGS